MTQVASRGAARQKRHERLRREQRQDAEEDDHDRLEQRGHRVDCIIDFIVVGFGNLQQHLVELARLLADVDHVHDDVVEDPALPQRLGDALALADGHRVGHVEARVGRLAGGEDLYQCIDPLVGHLDADGGVAVAVPVAV